MNPEDKIRARLADLRSSLATIQKNVELHQVVIAELEEILKPGPPQEPVPQDPPRMLIEPESAPPPDQPAPAAAGRNHKNRNPSS